MASAQPPLDVLARIDRPRLNARFTATAGAPITLLIGPPGSGKSDLVRAFAPAGAIVLRVGNERRRFPRFVHGFAQAVASVARGAEISFPRAWERSLQSRSPAVFLAHWLCEHLEGIGGAIVIDELHDGACDANIASFIASFCERRPALPIIIAGRTAGALPLPLWMATRQMRRPIDEAELRFDFDELAELAGLFDVRLDAKARELLLSTTAGWPITVAYALSQLRSDARTFATTRMPRSFEEVAEHVLARRTERERDFLLSASLLPSIEDAALRQLGWDDPAQMRTAMGSDMAFMWEHDAHGSVSFHDRFRDYLEREFEARDIAFRSTVACQTMTSLSLLGRHAAALEVATRQPIVKATGALLDAHGFALLDSGQSDVVSAALETVEESSLGATGLALRAYIEARSGHLDTAEAWFRLALDKAEDEASRATIALYYARELGLRRREDACDVLKAFAASTSLPRHLLIDVRSSYARALTEADRLEEARSLTDAALRLLDSDCPAALRARVFARAATVAVRGGETELARERALIAAPLAVEHCLYEVAASAYSTLYQIAYDFDDDALATMRYLGIQRELAMKSGALRIDLFVMIAMYELCAESGDAAALADLNGQLAIVDKHDATAEIMEGLIPAKALQASWSGDFETARRLVLPTAEHQVTPVRRALRWAQAGLYCTAARDAAGAAKALFAAEEALASVEFHERRTTQYGLAMLTLALAALVAGDVGRARGWMKSAAAGLGVAPRSCALRAAIDVMIAAGDDADRFARTVPAALEALWTNSFGGIAKLIEALPSPFGRAGANAPIGSALADAGPAAAQHFTGAAGSSLPLRPARSHARNGLIDDVDAALEALVAELDTAAPLMAEHSRAVSAWCSRLGRTLGLSEAEITFVTRCGLIHDIGKIRTPAQILEAPRKLTAQEWEIMRSHATDGSVMVGHVALLKPFVPIVRGHHERLDGKGYPDGLPAHAIPLAARIVTVADCFNAMIGRRPYRPAMAPTEALAELERHRGTQFDPEIVAAMVQVVRGRVA